MGVPCSDRRPLLSPDPTSAAARQRPGRLGTREGGPAPTAKFPDAGSGCRPPHPGRGREGSPAAARAQARPRSAPAARSSQEGRGREAGRPRHGGCRGVEREEARALALPPTSRGRPGGKGVGAAVTTRRPTSGRPTSAPARRFPPHHRQAGRTPVRPRSRRREPRSQAPAAGRSAPAPRPSPPPRTPPAPARSGPLEAARVGQREPEVRSAGGRLGRAGGRPRRGGGG